MSNDEGNEIHKCVVQYNNNKINVLYFLLKSVFVFVCFFFLLELGIIQKLFENEYFLLCKIFSRFRCTIFLYVVLNGCFLLQITEYEGLYKIFSIIL